MQRCELDATRRAGTRLSDVLIRDGGGRPTMWTGEIYRHVRSAGNASVEMTITPNVAPCHITHFAILSFCLEAIQASAYGDENIPESRSL